MSSKNPKKYKGPVLPQSHDEFLAWKDQLEKAKIQFLFKEELNPIRDSVTESRAPIHDIEGKEIPRSEHILMLEDPNHRVLADAHPLYDWENQKQRFKFWTPKKWKNGTVNKGKISHDLMDKLYEFWDRYIRYFENELKNQEIVKPSVKVFDILKSSWREDLTIEDLRKIQLKVEEMTYKFKGTSYLENTPQLKNIFFWGKSAKDCLLASLEDEEELQFVRAAPAWGVEPSVIWVLSKHFNVFSIEKKGVLAATLIEDLDVEVREYLNSLDLYESDITDGSPKAPIKRSPKARKKRG